MADETSVLVSIGEMIDLAIGTPEVGVVDFNMLQTVLHCLAQQLRVLGKNVELRSTAAFIPVNRDNAQTIAINEYVIDTNNKTAEVTLIGPTQPITTDPDTILVVERVKKSDLQEPSIRSQGQGFTPGAVNVGGAGGGGTGGGGRGGGGGVVGGGGGGGGGGVSGGGGGVSGGGGGGGVSGGGGGVSGGGGSGGGGGGGSAGAGTGTGGTGGGGGGGASAGGGAGGGTGGGSGGGTGGGGGTGTEAGAGTATKASAPSRPPTAPSARTAQSGLTHVSSTEKLSLVTLSKFNILENAVDDLKNRVYGSIPKNEDILEEVRSQTNMKAITDMWTSLNVSSRLEAAENGIAKISSLVEDLIGESTELQDALKQHGSKLISAQSAGVPKGGVPTQASGKSQMDPASAKSQMGPASGKSQVDPATGKSQVDPGTGKSQVDPGTDKSQVDPGTGKSQVDRATGKSQMDPASDKSQVGQPTPKSQAGQSSAKSQIGSASDKSQVEPDYDLTEADSESNQTNLATALAQTAEYGPPATQNDLAIVHDHLQVMRADLDQLSDSFYNTMKLMNVEVDIPEVKTTPIPLAPLESRPYTTSHKPSPSTAGFMEKLNELDKRLQRCSDSVIKSEGVLQDQINSLQDQLEIISKHQTTSSAPGQDIALGKISPDLVNDLKALMQLFQTVQTMQEQLTQVHETALTLAAEKEDRQHHINALLEQIELLKTIKLDREDMIEAMADKADLRMLARKVSHDQFELACDDLSRGLEHALGKLNVQESLWQQALDDIQREIETKLDKMELSPVKDFFNNKLKQLQENLKQMASLRREAEAAGTKRRLMRDVNCISCDAQAVMSMDAPMAMASKPLPASLSMKPYLSYELDAIRKTQASNLPQRNLHDWENIDKHMSQPKQPQKVRSETDKHLCNRYCGGSHTVTTPSQRVARLGHFIKQWGPDVLPLSSGLATGDDGRLYKVSPAEAANVGPGGAVEATCTPKSPVRKSDASRSPQKPITISAECRCLEGDRQ